MAGAGDRFLCVFYHAVLHDELAVAQHAAHGTSVGGVHPVAREVEVGHEAFVFKVKEYGIGKGTLADDAGVKTRGLSAVAGGPTKNLTGRKRFARVADLGEQSGKLHLFAHVEIVVGGCSISAER